MFDRKEAMKRESFNKFRKSRWKAFLYFSLTVTILWLPSFSSAADFELIKGELPDLPKSAWTTVVIPDTQNYTRKDNKDNIKILNQMFDWMAENKDARNIKVVVHVGDMTRGNEPEEWVKIRNSYKKIDGILPYVVCVGNHDSIRGQRTGPLDDYFKIDENPLNREFFVGSFEKNELENAYYIFEQNGQKYLYLSLEYGARDEVVEWADKVIKRHPDHHIFFTVHEFLTEKSRLLSKDGKPALGAKQIDRYHREQGNDSKGINSPIDLKHKLIDPNPNVEFLVNGHCSALRLNDDGTLERAREEMATAHLSSPKEKGLTFHAMLLNAQWFENGGDGWLMLLEFQADNKTVHVRTYSPYLKAYRTGPEYDYILHRQLSKGTL